MSTESAKSTCGDCRWFTLRNEPGYVATMGWCRCPEVDWVPPNAAGIVYQDSDDPLTCECFERKDVK